MKYYAARTPLISVADPGYLSRIMIFTHPGSRIRKQQQKRRVNIICCTFFCSHKFHKIENNFIFETPKKINSNFQRMIDLFTSVADPGCLSRILIFTHPGSRISDPGSKNSNKRER